MIKNTRPFWQIEMAAENLLRHCECFNTPYSAIDFMIASCNIDLIPIQVDNPKLMGLLGDDGNGHRFIAYNKAMLPERILFTKAHELGHFVLEHELSGDLLTDTKGNSKNPQETEANVFAAALLMPKKLFLSFLQHTALRLGLEISDGVFDYASWGSAQKRAIVSAMQERFHTSMQSVEYRISDLLESSVKRKDF